MRTFFLSLILISIFYTVSFSQFSDNDSTGTVTDIDGNVYKIVKIGDQWWMEENLKVTHYRNGDPIDHVQDGEEWEGRSSGAWCVYDNQNSNKFIYGLLYNWHVLDDCRSIAPEGWHVPTDEEWQILVDYLGGDAVAGGKMKTTGTIEDGDGLWNEPNDGATNEIGFKGLPGGYRLGNGNYKGLGECALFWSATQGSSSNAWGRYMYYTNSDVGRGHGNKRDGFSVRLVKNDATKIESSASQPINSPMLTQNYPNPFNPTTTIRYTVGATQHVASQRIDLSIFNLLGQKVATLVSEKQPTGRYQVEWNATGMASGVYYYRLETDQGFAETKKLIVLK